jgi:hypothetical protein
LGNQQPRVPLNGSAVIKLKLKNLIFNLGNWGFWGIGDSMPAMKSTQTNKNLISP